MVALYGPGMHDFVLREIEIGYRAACCEDLETSCGFTALDDIAMELDVDAERRALAERHLLTYCMDCKEESEGLEYPYACGHCSSTEVLVIESDL